eukprot:GHVT01070367.1.p1 GENE.GHVT01070367.1~~GHVT01070367.1.p1  ORF type:complete len:368 (+),score=94.40 GHVT01070367.1:417-1520(+)
MWPLARASASFSFPPLVIAGLALLSLALLAAASPPAAAATPNSTDLTTHSLATPPPPAEAAAAAAAAGPSQSATGSDRSSDSSAAKSSPAPSAKGDGRGKKLKGLPSNPAELLKKLNQEIEQEDPDEVNFDYSTYNDEQYLEVLKARRRWSSRVSKGFLLAGVVGGIITAATLSGGIYHYVRHSSYQKIMPELSESVSQYSKKFAPLEEKLQGEKLRIAGEYRGVMPDPKTAMDRLNNDLASQQQIYSLVHTPTFQMSRQVNGKINGALYSITTHTAPQASKHSMWMVGLLMASVLFIGGIGGPCGFHGIKERRNAVAQKREIALVEKTIKLKKLLGKLQGQRDAKQNFERLKKYRQAQKENEKKFA